MSQPVAVAGGGAHGEVDVLQLDPDAHWRKHSHDFHLAGGGARSQLRRLVAFRSGL